MRNPALEQIGVKSGGPRICLARSADFRLTSRILSPGFRCPFSPQALLILLLAIIEYASLEAASLLPLAAKAERPSAFRRISANFLQVCCCEAQTCPTLAPCSLTNANIKSGDEATQAASTRERKMYRGRNP